MKAVLLCLLLLFSSAANAAPVHGIAMHGQPKYGKNFKNFAYANPDAPKGGVLKMAASGTFDTFNPFVIKGTPAAGIALIYDTLTVESADEPFSEYGLIAQTIEMPKDRTWVAFNLNPKAKFSDGTSVTADDVVFSFNALREKGLPMYRYYYGNVAKAEAQDNNRVLFTFKEGDNRELPLILGQMPVLPKHFWDGKDFATTTLEIPVGSGPYRVKSFEQGRSVVYERNPDWWGRDLPVSKGFYNFDEIRYDYYRDATVAVEALKAGAYDLRIENEAKKWLTAYTDLGEKQGFAKKEFFHGLPSGMQGFVFNTRRPLFADVRVREAIALMFDFEWSNKNLFSGQYLRTKSYFDNSELAAKGKPSRDELALLNPFKDSLPPEVFTTPFDLPKTNASGFLRPQMRRAFSLLEQAGWTVRDGVLKNAEGQPFEFEILLDTASAGAWERITLPYVKNLQKLGIKATVRAVDMTQYNNRLAQFDYDMIVAVWGQSTSPGNEQRYFWGTAAADSAGSRNYAGIRDAAVDALIEKIIEAPDRQKLVAATRALDRVLMRGWYVVPHWYVPANRLVFWDKFGYPTDRLTKGVQPMTWWIDAAKESALAAKRAKKTEQKKTVFEQIRGLL